MNVVVFIIAMVLPSGEMDIKYSLLPECPDKARVEAFMNEKVEQGTIVKWAGTCSSIKAGTTEL